jgi:hypothetical protein
MVSREKITRFASSIISGLLFFLLATRFSPVKQT